MDIIDEQIQALKKRIEDLASLEKPPQLNGGQCSELRNLAAKAVRRASVEEHAPEPLPAEECEHKKLRHKLRHEPGRHHWVCPECGRMWWDLDPSIDATSPSPKPTPEVSVRGMLTQTHYCNHLYVDGLKVDTALRHAGFWRLVGQRVTITVTTESEEQAKGILIDESLEASCPQGYPWACPLCNRKRGLTIPCSGRR